MIVDTAEQIDHFITRAKLSPLREGLIRYFLLDEVPIYVTPQGDLGRPCFRHFVSLTPSAKDRSTKELKKELELALVQLRRSMEEAGIHRVSDLIGVSY